MNVVMRYVDFMEVIKIIWMIISMMLTGKVHLYYKVCSCTWHSVRWTPHTPKHKAIFSQIITQINRGLVSNLQLWRCDLIHWENIPLCYQVISFMTACIITGEEPEDEISIRPWRAGPPRSPTAPTKEKRGVPRIQTLITLLSSADAGSIY